MATKKEIEKVYYVLRPDVFPRITVDAEELIEDGCITESNLRKFIRSQAQKASIPFDEAWVDVQLVTLVDNGYFSDVPPTTDTDNNIE